MYDILVKYNQQWSNMEIICFLILLFITSIVLSILIGFRKINLRQAIAVVFLYVFMVIVFEATVFSREPVGYSGYRSELFWSWRLAANGETKYIEYIVLNMILLMPVGMLLPFVFNNITAIYKSIIAGLVISFAIEEMQLYTGRGIFEYDDIFSNTLGCVLGTILINILWFMARHITRLCDRKVRS